MWAIQRRHPTDEQLFALTLPGGEPTADLQEHVRRCPSCTRRSDELAAFCRGLSSVGHSAADEAVGPERLMAQRLRILRRLERIGLHAGPARVLRFPATMGRFVQSPARYRWIAAAAVAGLLVGLAAGRIVYSPVSGPAVPATARTMTSPETLPNRGAGTPSNPPDDFAEEAFMFEVEAALTASRIAELQTIDAMTPRILEAAVSPW